MILIGNQSAALYGGPQFWDITNETNPNRPGRKKPTPGWPFGPSWTMELAPLVPVVPAVGAAGEGHSTSGQGSGQMLIPIAPNIPPMHTLPTAVVEAFEQMIAESQHEQPTEGEEEPGTDLFPTPSSPPEGQVSLPPPLPSPGPAASHEESQSGEEDDASTSEEEMADTRLNRSKKPYCAYITSNHHQDHSAEVSSSQSSLTTRSTPVTG